MEEVTEYTVQAVGVKNVIINSFQILQNFKTQHFIPSCFYFCRTAPGVEKPSLLNLQNEPEFLLGQRPPLWEMTSEVAYTVIHLTSTTGNRLSI